MKIGFIGQGEKRMLGASQDLARYFWSRRTEIPTRYTASVGRDW